MNVYAKLSDARIKIHTMGLKKSGHNKFAGYQFFELQDFLVPALQVFKEVGLTGVVSFENEQATLSIINNDDPADRIIISSPMSEANLRGCHPIQNLGAVQTYLRRYLWVSALEIVEHDVLDTTTGEPEKTTPKSKPANKPAPKPDNSPLPVDQPTETPWAISIKSEDKWIESVKFSATELLKFAEKKEDVLEIFKINRPIFDRLMTENKDEYDSLMAVFAEHKNRF